MNNKVDEFVQILDTSSLQVGLEVKNYKEMCELLNEPIKYGNSKVSQDLNWQRYFSYTKQGHKYVIEDIYFIPKPPKDNSLYVRFVEYILANELATRKPSSTMDTDYAVNYTKTNLFYVLGMANNNYLRNNRKKVEENINNIPKWQIHDFFKRSDKQLSKILFDSLRSMKARSLLSFKTVVIIVEEKGSRIATEKEESLIDAAGNEVLIEMGLKKKPFWNIGQMNQFYDKLNKKLYADTDGMWKSVYSEIRIIYTREQILKNLALLRNELITSLLAREELLQDKKMTLNQNVINSVNKLAVKSLNENRAEHKKATKESMSNELDDDEFEMIYDKDNRVQLEEFFDYPDSFINNQKKLSELFLRIYESQEDMNYNYQ